MDRLPQPVTVADAHLAAILEELRGIRQVLSAPPGPVSGTTDVTMHIKEPSVTVTPGKKR